MKTTLHYYIIFFLLTVSFSAFPQKSLVILHTNDTHSRIEPLPETDRTFPGRGGVERRAILIDQIRKENKNVLLFDAGDFLQGTPYFNLFKGEVEIKSMNLMGYDAVTLGNHEFDYGLEILEKVAREADFPIVSSNYDFSQTPLKNLIEQYVILKRGGLRIGVIGINIQPRGLIATNNYEGMKFHEPIKTANETANLLRSKYKCDIIVCLSHLGYLSDLNLAESTKGIDIIIGGHSHTYLKEPAVRQNLENKDVKIFQTNGRGVFVGRMDIELEKAR
ncbi:MAG: metallophosphatase [Fermentimonas sp.]|jgi:5'-nucleotidase|nr:metallophosphatase [Fermentimonas sp.]NLC86365.1 bifunctional metallophosphatase/5'-nucleotidase [Bacteroidales bacterium]MDD2930739.1 metallophosphatase [Fermentimonas sp.]MDD3189180.1 metallophosphatase [Fermentimonas sp.]MDD3512314.1 metallophosphatase [Fermentimonas sp.]